MKEDKKACQKAYEISLDSRPILSVPYHDSLYLDELSTTRVVKGLVKICLKEPEYDYSGLSPLDALHQLLELYGINEIARISLEASGYVHESGMAQSDADKLIDRMCGTAKDVELALLT
ncbi:MAG TPA: hypothetical protein VHA05_03085 [Candidatus Saccharimonadales bacterium]|nr:hypothetical protein [Candidatus Saccharimonadales bacterium]